MNLPKELQAKIAMRPVVTLAEGANQGADLSPWCGPVFNQLQEGSCTACTTRDYLLWLQKKLGYAPIIEPSVNAIYYFGRQIFGDLSTDNGATVADAFEGTITYGVIPASDDTYVPATLYTPPPLSDAVFHATSFQRLAPTTASIRASLDAGVPVGIAVGVDQTLFRPAGYQGDMIVDTGANVPNEGHGIFSMAYRPDAKYGFLYKFQNSWGTGYGVGGFAWFTEAYLTANLYEVCTLAIAPKEGHA